MGDEFELLCHDQQCKVVQALLELVNAKKNKVDLSPVGRAKTAGQLKIAFAKVLNREGGITFVDQSVTGMFERRTHIGL